MTLTPAARDALIARAKALAVPVANCTAAAIPPTHLIGDATWQELYALVLVLADAADPRMLRAVATATDGDEDPAAEEKRLRQAHAEAERLRRAGQTVPLLVRVADNEYHARLKEARERQAAAVAREDSRPGVPAAGAA